MKRLIAIFFAISVVSQISCTTTKLYNNSNSNYPFTQLILKKNTFFYTSFSGLLRAVSDGTWENTSEAIFLNSDSTYRNGYLRVNIQGGKRLKETICVQIVSEEYDFPLQNAEVRINNLEQLITDKDGMACFQTSKIDSVIINFLGTYKWLFFKELKSDVKIFVNKTDESKEYFERERWQKVEGGLLSPEGWLLERTKLCRKCPYKHSLKIWREIRKDRRD